MNAITGGELLARCLASEGVRFVFGLPCPELDPLLAALDGHGVRFVPVRHEAAAVHMAEGVYKTSGEAAAVAGNPGPGSANLLPGVITARHEGVPVLVISAQHRLGIVYPASGAVFQGQDQLDIFRPAVKWGGPVLAWDRLAEVARTAFREMWAGRPGPVQLEIPGPVLYASGEVAGDAVEAPATYRPSLPQPSEAQLDAAAALLRGAERPVVVAGAGVDRGAAHAALLDLVEVLACPVIPTMAGRSAVPLDHPRCLYGWGGGADAARREADVLLVAGSRMGLLDLPYDKYWGERGRSRLVQIDVEPRNMGLTRPLSLGIVADLRPTLEGLTRRIERLGGPRRDRGEDLARYRSLDDATHREVGQQLTKWDGPGIHPAEVMHAVGRVFGRDSLYVTDGGITSLWAHWCLPATAPRSYHNILELGMLGTGVPVAIGAALAAPTRQVVCVSGDGAAGFNFMEMQSAAREGLRLAVVICADGSWAAEEPNQRRRYGRTFGTDMGTVHWDRVAEGLGCEGLLVEERAALVPALERARGASRPVAVGVVTDREANMRLPESMALRFTEVYQGPMG